MNDAYKNAGVDVEAGYESTKLIKNHIESTFTPAVLTKLGGFSGLFELGSGYKNPVLACGTDGVGTKLKIAFIMDKHNTIGIDAVAMCVNDIICQGAEPKIFLDYIATGKNYPEKIANIVEGVAEGCRQAGACLIGGETAEMPGFYPPQEYDLAGFVVGVVEKDEIIDGSKIKAGMSLVALPSSGLHSNGYSLVRKIFGLDEAGARARLNEEVEELGTTLGKALLEPTKIYVKEILKNKQYIAGIANITGGGFYENVPRMLPENTRAVVDYDKLQIPVIYDYISKLSGIELKDMFGTFNMGAGMVVATDSPEKFEGYVIGKVISGEKGIDII